MGLLISLPDAAGAAGDRPERSCLRAGPAVGLQPRFPVLTRLAPAGGGGNWRCLARCCSSAAGAANALKMLVGGVAALRCWTRCCACTGSAAGLGAHPHLLRPDAPDGRGGRHPLLTSAMMLWFRGAKQRAGLVPAVALPCFSSTPDSRTVRPAHQGRGGQMLRVVPVALMITLLACPHPRRPQHPPGLKQADRLRYQRSLLFTASRENFSLASIPAQGKSMGGGPNIGRR